jgi:hypothetical protein
MIILSCFRQPAAQGTASLNGSTDLRLPLAQHGLRGASLDLRAASVLGGLRVAGSVIDAVPDLPGVHPHELLGIVEPLHLELLLADRAEGVGRVIWDG